MGKYFARPVMMVSVTKIMLASAKNYVGSSEELLYWKSPQSAWASGTTHERPNRKNESDRRDTMPRIVQRRTGVVQSID
jgi:hypothetical protein